MIPTAQLSELPMVDLIIVVSEVLTNLVMQFFRITFLLLSGILLFSCGEKLPKPTQKGANTFGCKINGKKWVPDGGGLFSGIKPIRGGFHEITSFPVYKRGIFLRTSSQDGQDVEFFLNSWKTGKYSLSTDTQSSPGALYPKDYGYYQSANGTTYLTSSRYTGTVTISKADTATGIVAGTFEFTVGDTKGQTVKITDGRFDVNTRTL